MDSGVLNNHNYVGHSIVVKGYDEENLYFNDPGLPGVENRKVDFKLFEKAWSVPTEQSRNIAAFRLKS